MDSAKADRFVIGLVMPKIRRAIQSTPRRFAWNVTDQSKKQFISDAISKFLDRPENVGIKTMINKSKYKEDEKAIVIHGYTADEMRFLVLADKSKNVIS